MVINKFILIGDTHFGIRNFNKVFFDNQILLFKKQIIPFMLENNVQHIIQTGDLFDNRVVMDIAFFDIFMTEFVQLLEENNITLITILGNHDIYYKNRTDINLVKYVQKLSKSVISIQENTNIKFNDKNILLVPWLLEKQTLNYVDEDIIIGHFEIKNFQLTKGNIDTKSSLDSSYFKKLKAKKIYSGHYHINQEESKIHYIGTPYELNWGDFQNKCGFYYIEDNKETFYENTVSYKHIKVIWDERIDKLLIIGDKKIVVPFDEGINHIKDNYILKVTNLYSSNNSFEDFLFKLKENNIKYTFHNEQELQSIINPENVELSESKIKNADSFVLEYIRDNYPDLKDLITDILQNMRGSND